MTRVVLIALAFILALPILKAWGPQRTSDRPISVREGDVAITIVVHPGEEEKVTQGITSIGGKIKGNYRDLIDVLLPPSTLPLLTSHAGVMTWYPSPLLASDAILTEASQAGAGTGYTLNSTGGQGVKVGIIDSFAGYQALLGSELPPPDRVVYRAFTPTPGASRHGTAIAEIIHDLAPGATLYLAEAATVTEVAQAVDWLISQGVHIINMSLNAPFFPPSDGQGFDALTVEKAYAHGILWVNAAGNYGNKHWQGTWRDEDYDGYLEFAPGDEGNTLSAGGDFMVVLRWDDPWGQACNDYDLVVRWRNNSGQSGELISAQPQDCRPGAQPLEMVSGAATQGMTLEVRVRKRSLVFGGRLEVFAVGGTLEHVVPEGSVAPPADSAKALAVGAAPHFNMASLHSYSSRGPGARGSIKPDVVGPDNVSTASFGPGAFAGTSAAAPHVTGIAALIKSLHPDWGPDQIREAIRQWTIDMGAPGPDNSYGWGAVDVARFIHSLLSVAPSWAGIEPFDNGHVQVMWGEGRGATYYQLCIDLRHDFSSPYASCFNLPASSTAHLVEVPSTDQSHLYFQVRACNAIGCSQPAFAGGVSRRSVGGPTGWDYYFTAYNRDGFTVAAVRNLRNGPTTIRLYRGLVGAFPWFSLEKECTNVPTGGVCRATWQGNWINSAVQSLAPWWDLATAIVTVP